ncbi:MAG: PD-(D/E)XK nuclease family protein, partial [Planctomycetes bacterium]|nr:PD-(D/E)XK nuclease family protein [Planctomycetota bacterium]
EGGEEGEGAPVFSAAEETRRALHALGRWEEARLGGPHEKAGFAGPIRALERGLFALAPKKAKNDGAVRFIEAATPEVEMRMVCREIRALLNEGARPEEIGVFFRTFTPNRDTARDVFARYGIPAAIPGDKALADTALGRFVLRLARAAAARAEALEQGDEKAGKAGKARKAGKEGEVGDADSDGWDEETFRALLFSTALARAKIMEDVDLDALGKFLSEKGVGARKTREEKEAWKGAPEGSRAAQLALIAAIDAIAAAARDGPKAFVKAVAHHLDVWNVRDALVEANTANGAADAREALRLREVFESFSAYAAAAEEAVKAAEVTQRRRPAEFAGLLREFVEAESVGGAGSAAGSVWIGGVFGTRVPPLRAAFVCGLTDGGFPHKHPQEPFFTDAERRLLRGAGLPLDPRSREAEDERFLFYVAATRASQRLYLCRPVADGTGKETMPSPFLDEVWAVLDATVEQKDAARIVQDAAKIAPDWEKAASRDDLLDFAADALWRPVTASGTGGHAPADLARWSRAAAAVRALGDDGTRVLEAGHRNEHEARLRPETVALLFDDELPRLSPSAMNDFAACPFRYFVKKTLRVEEWQEPGMDVLQEGSLSHEVLAEVMRKYTTETSAEDAVTHARERFDEIAGRDYPSLLDSQRGKTQLGFLWEKLQTFLLKELERMKASGSRPLFLEIGFGVDKRRGGLDRRSSDRGLVLTDESGNEVMEFIGVIDRVDLVRVGPEKREVAVVYDYKSGNVGKFQKRIKAALDANSPLLQHLGLLRYVGRAKDDQVDLQVPLYLMALGALASVPKGVPGLWKEVKDVGGGMYYSLRDSTLVGICTGDTSDVLNPQEHADDETKKARKKSLWNALTAGRKAKAEAKAETASDEELEAVIDQARKKALGIAHRLKSGVVAINPTDCDYCDFSDVCRFRKKEEDIRRSARQKGGGDA